MEHITHLGVVLARPEGDRRPPVTIPRDVPIPRVPQPAAEAAFLDVARDPVGVRVVLDETILDLLDLDKPDRDSAVDEWGVGADDGAGSASASLQPTQGLEGRTASRTGTSA